MEYYTHVRLKNEYHAGNKATDDIADICKKMGMRELSFPKLIETNNKVLFKLWILFVSLYYWLKYYFKLKDGDILLFQHPMYGARMTRRFVPKIKRKGCKCIAIIHDLESLRNSANEAYIVSNKTAQLADDFMLRQFDAVICHNKIMHNYLIGRGFDENRVVDLVLFDYLTDSDKSPNYKNDQRYSVTIAGNLTKKKSGYIYDFINRCPQSVDIHMFGVGFDLQSSKDNVHYEGAFPPDVLCSKLNGDWGIVWDGPSAEQCTGNTGNYLKYNNPHKLSLYLVSNIPVIVWSQSAVSNFVKENNVGIVVDSLLDIEDRLKEVSSEDYNVMVKNTIEISQKQRLGQFFQNAYGLAKDKCSI